MTKNIKLSIISTILLIGTALVLSLAVQRSNHENEKVEARQAMIERDASFAERQRGVKIEYEQAQNLKNEKENELKYLARRINLLKNNCENSDGCLRKRGVIEALVLSAYNEKWGENLKIDWQGRAPFKTINNQHESNKNSDPLRSGIITMNMNACRNSVKAGANYRGVGTVVVIDTSEAYIARVPIAPNRYDAYDLVTCSRPDGTRGVKRIKI